MRSFNVFSNPSLRSFKAAHGIAAVALVAATASAFAQTSQCAVNSGPTITPVVELYTSEGCSSCPPADKWASSLKGSGAVVHAFHVGYWDYIGWVDRFADATVVVRPGTTHLAALLEHCPAILTDLGLTPPKELEQ